MAADEIVARYKLEVEQAAKNAERLAGAADKVGKSAKEGQAGLDKMGASASNFGKQMAGALGITLGIVGVVAAVKSAAGTMMDFEQQMAKVKAISGATAAEMKKLEANAKALGASTKFTATEVGQLQEEYARLGFSTKEILAATEATLNLAAATGETLAASAEVAGSTVRSFGLDASETGRVTDVMAKSFSLSALNLERFRESMKLVAPIARAANIDLETTTALLGTLANAGLSGSLAGTALKNLLSKLSDANSDLSGQLGYTVKNADDLKRAFRDLAKMNIDLTAATELTDERSKAAFITLFNGIDTVDSLKVSLDNAAGSAKEMADIMNDTARGSLLKVQSAFEGLILALDKSPKIKAFFNMVANVLTGLTYWTGALDNVTKEAIETERAQKNLSDATERYNELVKYAADDETRRIKAMIELETQMRIYSKTQDKIKAKEDELQKVMSHKAWQQEQASKAAHGARASYIKDIEVTDKRINSIKDELDRLNRLNDKVVAYVDLLNNKSKAGEEDNAVTKEAIKNFAYWKAQFELYQKQLEDTNQTEAENLISVKKMNEARAEMDRILGKTKDKIEDETKAWKEWLAQVKAFEDGIKKWQDTQLAAIDTVAEREKLYALRTYTDKKTLDEQLAKIEQQRLADRIALLKTFNRETLAEEIKLEQDKISEFERLWAELQAQAKAFEEAQTNDYQTELEKRKKLAEDFFRFEEELRQERMMLANTMADFTIGLVNRVNQYQTNIERQRLDDIDDMLKKGVINEEQAAMKKKQIAREQAKRNKEIATFQAVISTAMAVVNALATAPNFIVGAIMAAAAGVLGAAEIITIQNEPLPQFEKGGWIEGKKHKQGGVKVEAEGGEFITNVRAAKKWGGLLEYINTNPVNLNGWDGLADSIKLNSSTTNQFNDRNLLSAIDRHREAEVSTLRDLLHELRKSNGKPMRGGYYA